MIGAFGSFTKNAGASTKFSKGATTTLTAKVGVPGIGANYQKDSEVTTKSDRSAQVSSSYLSRSSANKYVCSPGTEAPLATNGFVFARDVNP